MVPRDADDLTDPQAADPIVGRLVADRYRVEEWIARGGMSRVYRARDLHADRTVALKVLRPPRGEPVELYARWFADEAATGAALRHPNTVQTYDWGHTPEGTWFLALEYVDGRTLSAAIKDGPIDPGRALRVALALASSLEEAHGHGIVHRDLKPANVMLVDQDGAEVIKVIDFGISVNVQEDPTHGAGLGSPRYVAPEQIKQAPIDHRVDIYSFGIIVYEMLVGRPPFVGNRAVGVLLAHLHEAPKPVAEAAPTRLAPSLTTLVDTCLEKDPARRPATMAEVARGLRLAALEMGETLEEPVVPVTAQPAPLPMEKTPARISVSIPVLVVGVTVAFILVLGALVVACAKPPPPSAPEPPPPPVAASPALPGHHVTPTDDREGEITVVAKDPGQAWTSRGYLRLPAEAPREDWTCDDHHVACVAERDMLRCGYTTQPGAFPKEVAPVANCSSGDWSAAFQLLREFQGRRSPLFSPEPGHVHITRFTDRYTGGVAVTWAAGATPGAYASTVDGVVCGIAPWTPRVLGADARFFWVSIEAEVQATSATCHLPSAGAPIPVALALLPPDPTGPGLRLDGPAAWTALRTGDGLRGGRITAERADLAIGNVNATDVAGVSCQVADAGDGRRHLLVNVDRSVVAPRATCTLRTVAGAPYDVLVTISP